MVEIGDHLVFECEGTRIFISWDWRRVVDLDVKSKCAYEYEEDGRVKVGDRVEDFFGKLDYELCGVGSVCA